MNQPEKNAEMSKKKMKRKKNKKTRPAPPSFWSAYWYCWKNWNNFTTPARRREYWGFWIPTYLLGVCCAGLAFGLGGAALVARRWFWAPIVGAVLAEIARAFFLVPGDAVNARRDLDLKLNATDKAYKDAPEAFGLLVAAGLNYILFVFVILGLLYPDSFVSPTKPWGLGMAIAALCLLIFCKRGYTRGRRRKKGNERGSRKARKPKKSWATTRDSAATQKNKKR